MSAFQRDGEKDSRKVMKHSSPLYEAERSLLYICGLLYFDVRKVSNSQGSQLIICSIDIYNSHLHISN